MSRQFSAYERMVYRQLRRRRRRAARRGNVEEVEKLTRAMTTPEAFHLVVESVVDRSDVPVSEDEVVFFGEESDTPFIDALIRLFQWIIDNWDEIMKIISVIVSLFEERPELLGED